MVAESQRWSRAETSREIDFHVEGAGVAGATGPLLVAGGRVVEAEAHRLRLSSGTTVTLRLPAAVSLTRLRGALIRVALQLEGPPWARARTLVLSDAPDGTAWLVARVGRAGQVHALDAATHVRTALSQRAGGPMTIGTERLQHIVRVGQAVAVAGRQRRFVVHLEARSTADDVGYVIVERSLWLSDRP